jgi:hypothetical protein
MDNQKCKARIKNAKNAKKYNCELCDFSCSNKYNYNLHLSTLKHLKKKKAKNAISQIFKCENCDKCYNQSQGLSRHKKKCKIECNIYVTDVTENVTNVTKSEMSKMKCPESEMSENFSFAQSLLKIIEEKDKIIEDKNGIIEQQMDWAKSHINSPGTNKSNNVNSLNTQNNNLTVNVYLNEHCKDAMNIKDFVEKVKVSLDDLQYTTDNGFAEGISNIFMKQLNDMKPTERPIHCTDAKRCKFYVKDENNDWKKDAENKKIDKSISDITFKQIKMLKVWEGANPSWNSNTILSMRRQEIICKIMGGRDMEDQAKNRKKIKQLIGETIKLKDAMKIANIES